MAVFTGTEKKNDVYMVVISLALIFFQSCDFFSLPYLFSGRDALQYSPLFFRRLY